ncbi:MAG: M1 family metallopeptidase [Bacteroidetes bacterium]|nr:M1 family metallopeptidase [Bacteroidota bacterium]
MRTGFFCVLLFFSLHASAQQMLHSDEWCAIGRKSAMPPGAVDGRSDSIDIRHTRIELNVASSPQISGVAFLDLKVLASSVASIRLDLEGLTVDSVLINGLAALFTQSPASFSVQFPVNQAIGDSMTLKIAYHGTPVTDESGWGGVLNQSGYFYNLGVGFAADPHSFGRAWFPCFDNFVERCSFECIVVSNASKPAYCNGALISEIPLPNGLTQRYWKLDEQIPSYLACFATGPYTSFKRTYPGVNGPIPVEIAAVASDTNKVAGTFQHLPQAINAFEYWYGPYLWNKIGYSLVPFNAGAMEHATNIAIMRSAIDGTTGMETLWAHELSHHWWGDLATCTTAEDMWLNEGWAVYSEHLFTEAVYGEAAYKKAVRDNFLNVLQNTHVAEDGYRAVSGLPHDLTYGDHVYKKGAVVAHNLRGYLGDSLFRVGVRYALEHTRFDDWSSAEFRDKLEQATGQDMDPFFDNWVFQPGFTHFSVDSFSVQAAGNQYHVSVFIKQKLRGAPLMFQQVPLECTFVSDDWQQVSQTGTVSGENSVLTFDLPFQPRFVWLNTHLSLTLAQTDVVKVLTAPGQYSFSPAKMDVKVDALQDSALVCVEYHFAMPDTAGTANPLHYKLTNRYWTVSGDLPDSFNASANVFYDGRGALDQLDHELFLQTSPSEDSLRLIYRPGPGYAWQEYPTYFKNTLTSATDRWGFIRIEHLIPGEYTFAKGVSTVSTIETSQQTFKMRLSPNPARRTIHVVADMPFEKALLFSSDGLQVQEWSFAAAREMDLKLEQVTSGTYWILLSGKHGASTASLVISR